MPTAVVIPATEVVSTRKGRPASEDARALEEYCVAQLTDALESEENSALIINLEEGERASSVQGAFRKAEKILGITIRFGAKDDGERTYTNNRGRMSREQGSFFVSITSRSGYKPTKGKGK